MSLYSLILVLLVLGCNGIPEIIGDLEKGKLDRKLPFHAQVIALADIYHQQDPAEMSYAEAWYFASTVLTNEWLFNHPLPARIPTCSPQRWSMSQPRVKFCAKADVL